MHVVREFMSLPHKENNNDNDGGGEENDAEGIAIEDDGRNEGNYYQINVFYAIVRPKSWDSESCLLSDLLDFDTI